MAATLGTVPGNFVGIFIEGALIACSTSATLDLGTNMISSSCKDSGNSEQSTPGQKNWSMSLDGNLAFDASYGWADLFEAWENQTKVVAMWTTNVTTPGTPETGDPFYSGDAYIESLSASAPVNDVTTYSVSFKGTGLLTSGTNA